VECHMPVTVYMVVDARRDHSIRIPRPDLSVKLGVPNACNKCHTDKSAQWATDNITKWYGHVPVGFQHFAQALSAGTSGAPGAEKMLTELIADRGQPAIARASALTRLGALSEQAALDAARQGVTDDNSLVRRAAASALADADPSASAAIVAPLLNDPVRAVRIEAAEVLAGAPADTLAPSVEAQLGRAIDQYIAAQELNADRPEAHLDLALLYARRTRFGEAESELRNALSLEPSFVPAAVNLADLYRELGRDPEGERVLLEALAHSPNDASLEYALGLLLIRRGQRKEALAHLAAAANLDRSNARFAYAYAVALDDAGQSGAAIDVLRSEIELRPFDGEALGTLASLCAKTGSPKEGLTYAKRLLELEPDNAEAQQLYDQIGRAAGHPGHRP
jgi:tetratricopeptide (TPR) repeat protein